jgi:preprotein translocase subunit YajC
MRAEDTTRVRAALANLRPRTFDSGQERRGYLTGLGASGGPAVAAFRAGGWRDTNTALRTGNGSPQAAAGIDDEMRPLPDDLIVDREVPAAMFGNVDVRGLAGARLTDAAYTSTRLGDQPAAQAGMVRMRIAVPAGTRAVVDPDTGEVLLARGTDLAITSVTPNDAGGWDMHAAVIPRSDSNAGGGDQGDAVTPAVAPAVNTDAQQAATRMSRNYNADVTQQLDVYEALSAEDFAALPDATRNEITDRVTRHYQMNPGLRNRAAAVMARATTGNDREKWQRAADRPAYTPNMERVGRYALVGPRSSSTLNSTPRERFATYRALTGDEYTNLHSQERAFIANEIRDAEAGRFGAETRRGARELRDRLAQLTREQHTRRPDGDAAPAPAPAAPAAPAAGTAAASPFDELDQARIRNAVAEHAAGYYGGPLNLGRDDAARYVSEGHLGPLVSRHGLNDVWEAVAAEIERNPDALTPDRAGRSRAIRERADDASTRALAHFKAGELDQALAAIAEGEAADPDFRTARGVSWSSMREAIDRKRSEPAPAAAAPAAAAAPRTTERPRIRNTWGASQSTDEVSYHPDGEIGRVVDGIGGEAQLEIEGDSLANVLGRAATDVTLGRITPQQGMDRYRAIAEQLPEGSNARRRLDMAIENMDAPDTGPPTVPAGTPAPIRQLAEALHAIPLMRRHPDREVARLNQVMEDFAAGRTGGLQLINAVRAIGNVRHESESDAGKGQIDQAVTRAVRALEEMRRTDRASIMPPRTGAAATPTPAAVEAPAASVTAQAAMQAVEARAAAARMAGQQQQIGLFDRAQARGDVDEGQGSFVDLAGNWNVGNDSSTPAAAAPAGLDETQQRFMDRWIGDPRAAVQMPGAMRQIKPSELKRMTAALGLTVDDDSKGAHMRALLAHVEAQQAARNGGSAPTRVDAPTEQQLREQLRGTSASAGPSAPPVAAAAASAARPGTVAAVGMSLPVAPRGLGDLEPAEALDAIERFTADDWRNLSDGELRWMHVNLGSMSNMGRNGQYSRRGGWTQVQAHRAGTLDREGYGRELRRRDSAAESGAPAPAAAPAPTPPAAPVRQASTGGTSAPAGTGPGVVPLGGTDADRRAARPRLPGETDRAYDIRTSVNRESARRKLIGFDSAALRAIARDEGVETSSSDTKTDLLDRLVAAMYDRHDDGGTSAPAGRSAPAMPDPPSTEMRERLANFNPEQREQLRADADELRQRRGESAAGAWRAVIEGAEQDRLTGIGRFSRSTGAAPPAGRAGTSVPAGRSTPAAPAAPAASAPADARAAKIAAKEAELEAARARFQAAADYQAGGSSKRITFVRRMDAALARAGKAGRDIERLEHELAVLRLQRREASQVGELDVDGLQPGDLVKMKNGLTYKVVKVNRTSVKVQVPPGMDDLMPKSKIVRTQKADRGDAAEPAAPAKPARAATVKPAKAEPSEVWQRMEQARTYDEIRTAVDDLKTIGDMLAAAKAAGVVTSSSWTKARLREALINAAGRRLDSQAITRMVNRT